MIAGADNVGRNDERFGERGETTLLRRVRVTGGGAEGMCGEENKGGEISTEDHLDELVLFIRPLWMLNIDTRNCFR